MNHLELKDRLKKHVIYVATPVAFIAVVAMIYIAAKYLWSY